MTWSLYFGTLHFPYFSPEDCFTREGFSNFLPAGVNKGDIQLVRASASILLVNILKLMIGGIKSLP